MKNTTLPQQINNHFMDANATNIYETKKLVFQTSKALKAILIGFLVFILSIILLNTTAQTVNTFTTSGSWICPAGVTAIKVECWGGGGAGGGANQTRTGGGGGGGGSYNSQTNLTVVPGTAYSYTVGTGGVGTITNGASGGLLYLFQLLLLAVLEVLLQHLQIVLAQVVLVVQLVLVVLELHLLEAMVLLAHTQILQLTNQGVQVVVLVLLAMVVMQQPLQQVRQVLPMVGLVVQVLLLNLM